MAPSGSSVPWTVHQQLTFRRIPESPGVFGLFVQHELPDGLPKFEFQIKGRSSAVDLESVWGYTFESDQRLVWDGLTTKPRAHLTLSLNSAAEGQYADTADWTLARKPLYSVSPRRTADDLDLRQEYRVAGDGVVSDDADFLYLGEYDEWSVRAGDETIRLIVPVVADLNADPRAVLRTLARASKDLDVGCRSEEVVAIAAPTGEMSLDNAGLYDSSSGFWVKDDHRIDTLQQGAGGSTWVHEYVHTRQGFVEQSTKQTSWLIEAFASYYAGLFPFRQGRVSYEEFLSYVRTDVADDAVLTDTYTLIGSSIAPYTKGRRVLAALDCKIQRASDGTATLLDVFRELNRLDTEELTYTVFEEIFEQFPGESYDRWLERYARSSDVPPVPDSRNCFETWVSGPR